MMKWGRKKKNTQTPSSSSHSSSSPHSLISHAFPMSWLSRFKKGGSESEEVNVKGKRSFASPKSGVSSDSWNGGRFYGRDDDSYWSLSFRKDRLKGDVGTYGLKPGQYNSDDELHSPLHVVTPRRKAKESGSLQKNYGYSGKVDVRTRRRRGLEHRKSGEESGRIWEEGKEFQRKSDKGRVSSARSVEKEVFEVKPGRVNKEMDKDSQKHSRRQHSISLSKSIDLGTIEEDCIFEGLISDQSNTSSEDELSHKSQNQKNKKIDDIMLMNENQKTSLHLRKERQRRRRKKQSQKVNVCSPRSPAKIKALEDMKRARMKTKKMIKEEAVKDMTNFDSFAVVKCSVDPEEDFRESMVEMIRENGIRKPEVLEELLACYLTLNCDEYHSLIVKVFREVWLDLNQAQFHQELELINCCYL